MLIFWWMTTRHTSCTASCLPVKAAVQKARLSFLLIHLDPYVHTHTDAHIHTPSVTPYAPAQGWNWAPYLLHCLLNDAVTQWDKDTSQDGYCRPKHSSGYQPALSGTAAHGGGVRFPSVRLCVCLSALLAWQTVLLLPVCLWCVLVCAARLCVCVPEAAAARAGCTIRGADGAVEAR